jgi:hypothetical protein
MADAATVRSTLAAGPSWCAVVRPDGHLAAVLDAPTDDALRDALLRACGQQT